MSSNNIEQARTTARKLAIRIKTDSAFKAQVQKEPVSTLIAMGLPEEFIPDFLRETQLTDVSGYIGGGTCLLTIA